MTRGGLELSIETAEQAMVRLDLGEDLGYELRLAASPDVVFAYWIDPELLVTWMGKIATLDPRPGGHFRLEYGTGDVVSGEYREAERPRRVALTWGWEGEDSFPPGSTTIDVDIEDAGDGGSRMRLRHARVPDDVRANVDEGWGYFLPRLLEATAKG